MLTLRISRPSWTASNCITKRRWLRSERTSLGPATELAGLQAFVQRFPGESEREWADGVDGVEVTAADREPVPGVLAVRGEQEPFHGDRGAVVVGHPDDPAVRDAGGGVLRALVPDVGGDGVG